METSNLRSLPDYPPHIISALHETPHCSKGKGQGCRPKCDLSHGCALVLIASISIVVTHCRVVAHLGGFVGFLLQVPPDVSWGKSRSFKTIRLPGSNCTTRPKAASMWWE